MSFEYIYLIQRNMTSRISIITLGVSDMTESLSFYRDGLGFPTTARDADDWAIFRTSGSRLAIFPKTKLAEDIGINSSGTGFGGITLAHNMDSREEVDAFIERAIGAGGKLLKSPQTASWGGYSGYFADPDGYPWEIAWGEDWVFDDHGILWGGSLGTRRKANKTDHNDANKPHC